MKKRATISTTPVFAVAALVFLLLIAGCTTSKPVAEPVVTPPATTIQTTATTMTVVPATTAASTTVTDDKLFTDAAEACYNSTPVITDLTTHLAFATCMKDTPLPSGNCAQNFRYYVLKSTNEDATTAGFARETNHRPPCTRGFPPGRRLRWDSPGVCTVRECNPDRDVIL